MSIFDLIQSQELVAYWDELAQDREPYLGEELFPVDKKRGLDLKWIKGAKGLPVVLKTSAYDVTAVPRARIGFEKMMASMPFFKESSYIDEELRQELNMVLETGNQAYIDSIVNRVFSDEIRLLEGAAASRERMRMMALTTGVISMAANGQSFVYDYDVTHKGNAAVSWATIATADPMEDIRLAIDEVRDATGVVLTRAVCDGKTWKNLRNNEKIKKEMFVLSGGQGAISDVRLRTYMMDELGIEIVVNDKRYVDEAGSTVRYVPEDTFVLFPSGTLGKTWFGTTPEESDLMGGKIANVTLVDTGVAVTTMEKADPVNVETKVTMICLPSFEAADHIYIMDTVQA